MRREGNKRSNWFSRLWLLSVVMVAVVALTACGGGASQPQDNEDENGAADGDPIKIGVLSPFSGPFASVGKLKVDTFNLLLADVNESGGINGRPVTFVAGDSQGTANEARNQALRLIEQEQVDLLIGAYLSEETVEIMEVAADKGIPLLIPTSASNEINAKIDQEPERYRHIFRVGYNITQWARMMGDFILSRDAGSYAFVGANIRWNQEFGEELAEYLDGHDVIAAFPDEFYSPSQPVFDPILQKIQDTNPDVVVLGDPGQNAVELVKRIRQAGLEVPIFSVGGAMGDERAAATINPLGELYFQAAAWMGDDGATDDYFQRFKSEYEYPLVGYTDILTHDAIQIAVETLRRVDEVTPDALAETLAEGEFQGLAGTYTFGPDHQPPWEAGSDLSGVVVQWVAPETSQRVWPR